MNNHFICLIKISWHQCSSTISTPIPIHDLSPTEATTPKFPKQNLFLTTMMILEKFWNSLTNKVLKLMIEELSTVVYCLKTSKSESVNTTIIVMESLVSIISTNRSQQTILGDGIQLELIWCSNHSQNS